MQFDIQAALKDGVPQAQINAFLAQNQHLETPGYSAPAQTFGSGILGSILNPIARYGQNALGAGYELFRGAKTALGDKNAYVDPNGNTVQNPFLSEQQLSSFDSGKGSSLDSPMAGLQNLIAQLGTKNSGVRQGLKDTANVASYAVPFGKGAGIVQKALLPGAIAGGLQSISGENVTPEGVATGIVGGAATSGVLDVLGGILGKAFGNNGLLNKSGSTIEDIGGKVRGGVSDIKVRPSVYGASEEDAIKKTLQDLGISGNPQSQYEQLLPKMNELGQTIQTELKSSPKIVDTSVVKDAFKKNLQDLVLTRDMTNKQAQSEVNGFLKDLYNITINGNTEQGLVGNSSLAVPDKMSTEDIFKLKQKVGDLYGAVKDKMDRGIPLTSRDKVTKGFRDALDSIITQEHPSIKDATIQQSHLYEAAPSLARARTNPPTQRIFGTSVPASITQGAQDIVGSKLQQAGQEIQKIPPLSQLPPALQQALMVASAKTPSLLNGSIGNVPVQSGGSNVLGSLNQGLMPSNSSQNANGQNEANPPSLLQSSLRTPMIGGLQQSNNNNGNNNVQMNLPTGQNTAGSIPQSGITKEQVAAAQLYLPPAIAERVQKAYEAQLGNTQQQTVELSKSKAKNALDAIETAYNSNNLAGGRVGGKLSQILSAGGFNPNLQSYEAARAAVAPLLARALGNMGNLNEKEQEAAIKLLPTAQSTPEEARQGFEKLRTLLGLQ